MSIGYQPFPKKLLIDLFFYILKKISVLHENLCLLLIQVVFTRFRKATKILNRLLETQL